MSKINEEIKMEFPFDWTDGLGQEKPCVNRLLQAIIRGDVKEMNMLFDKGATIDAMDDITFRVVINKVLSSYKNRYEIVNCLVGHGFNCLRTEAGASKYNDDFGLTSGGYSVGLFALAYYNNDIKLAQLLIDNGFFEMYSTIRNNEYTGEGIDVRRKLFKQQIDWNMIRYLLSQSLPKCEIIDGLARYYSQDSARDVMENVKVKRIGFALDPCQYSEIEKPQLEKETFFNRRKIREENALLMEDYEDRVHAQEIFIQKHYGTETWKFICKKKKEYQEWLASDDTWCSPEFIERVFASADKKGL